MKKRNILLLLCGVFSLSVVKPAHAYIDPGTGSFLFQLIIAGALGGLFFIKSIVRSVKLHLSTIFGKKKVKESSTTESHDHT